MMRSLDDLTEYFYNLTIYYEQQQIDELYSVFYHDFIESPFTLYGYHVKTITANSKVDGFEDFPETFVHLITRKTQANKRVFDPKRANKIHWIKPVLLNCEEEEIKYFEFQEAKGNVRDYYWYEDGEFVVIMERITPDYLVITSFNVDEDGAKRKFEKRYKRFINARK